MAGTDTQWQRSMAGSPLAIGASPQRLAVGYPLPARRALAARGGRRDERVGEASRGSVQECLALLVCRPRATWPEAALSLYTAIDCH